MKRTLPAVLTLAVLAVAAQAQDLDRARPLVTQHVSVGPIEAITITPGKTSIVEMPFRVDKGFHINSNKPNSEVLIPTVVKMSPPTDIGVGLMAYPEGRDLSFPFAPTEKLNVYTGDFLVSARVSAAKTTPPGTYRVRGALQYQACDDRACYPPTQVPLMFDVHITKVVKKSSRKNPAQSPHVHQ